MSKYSANSILILFFALTNLFLQYPVFPQGKDIRFRRISLEQGLSQSSVLSITQDKYGFMWFGTLDGLNKYDGYKISVYRHNPLDSTTVCDLGIRKVFTDSRENLWVISLSGKLDRYDYSRDIFQHYQIINDENSRSDRIIAITESSSGELILGATSGKLYDYDSRQDVFHPIVLENIRQSMPADIHLQSLCMDNSGNIWMGTWEGLIKIPALLKNSLQSYKSPVTESYLKDNIIMNIAKDGNGNIWVAMTGGGIAEYKQNEDKFQTYTFSRNKPGSLSSNRVMSIFVDDHYNTWIGTIDAGLCLLKHSTKVFINYKDAPSNNNSIGSGAVMSFFQDNSGGVWIGTSGGGVSRFDDQNQRFHTIYHNPGDPGSLSNNAVLNILKDSQNRLWIGTDGGGLNCRKQGDSEFRHFLTYPSFGSNSITAIYEDSRGTIWAANDPGKGSVSGGIYTLEKGWDEFLPFKKLTLKIGGIQSICEDKQKNIWFGAVVDGLWCYDPEKEKITNYKNNPLNKNSICGNSIFVLLSDSYGKLWIGTQNTGLSCYDPVTDRFRNFSAHPAKKDSLNSNSIWSLYEDTDRNIWIGTWGGGLNLYERKKNSFRQFTTNNGLPSDIVCSILPDDQGNLWLGTQNGLTKFNIKEKTCKNYFQSDGLQSDEFNQGAASRSADGLLYFGGVNGVTGFNPADIIDNKHIPPVLITQFYLKDAPIKSDLSITSTMEVRLSYEENFFSIEFAALDYTSPEKNQYTFKLEGLDKDWIKTNKDRRAYYTNISPGEYLFRVKGANSDGIWNPVERTLSIIITPPFWQTWWFRGSILFILVLILNFIHKYRVNKLLEVERTRLRIAKDLHDDVSATLTGIAYFSNAISKEAGREASPVMQKLISLIQESTAEVQEGLHDIIWSINPENDKWDVIFPKFRRFASDLCESKGIYYNIDIPESIPGKSLSMEQRRNLWLIFKEIIANGVKHADCTQIIIIIKAEKENLFLKIKDNGKGFNSSISTDRNGLKNIKSRSALLKAKLKLETSEGNGTEWQLWIPIQ